MAWWQEGLSYLWQWVCSPGFGGFAGLTAAGLAYRSTKMSDTSGRDDDRIAWALEKVCSANAVDRAIGMAVLEEVTPGLDKDSLTWVTCCAALTAAATVPYGNLGQDGEQDA